MSAGDLTVAFDGQIFVEQAAGGISRYYTMLAADLNAKPGVSACIVAPLHRNEILATSKNAPVWGVALPNRSRVAAFCGATLRALSMPASWLLKPDIVHETYFSSVPVLSSGKKRVTTVYDMIHERYHPDDVTVSRKRQTLARCDHVICISQNTKNDLCEMLDFPPERASVTYLGYEDFSRAAAAPSPPELNGAPYFLFVGNRAGHKNFDALLQAFAGSADLAGNFSIAYFGGGRLTDAESQRAATLGLRSQSLVQLSGGDTALGAAYANATAFIYPSLYEGFGLPPLEAMSAGCPVICSNTSSLPEVVGDAAMLVAPDDIEALRDAMQRLAYDSQAGLVLAAKGHLQRAKFASERCADETAAIYRRLLQD